MKESQPKRSNVKIEEVDVVTQDDDYVNDVLFVSSCFSTHAVLADRDGDMHPWILDSGAHVTLIVNDYLTTRG